MSCFASSGGSRLFTFQVFHYGGFASPWSIRLAVLADLGFDVVLFGLTITAVLQNPRQIMCWGEAAVFMRYHSFFLSTLNWFERIAFFVVQFQVHHGIGFASPSIYTGLGADSEAEPFDAGAHQRCRAVQVVHHGIEYTGPSIYTGERADSVDDPLQVYQRGS